MPNRRKGKGKGNNSGRGNCDKSNPKDKGKLKSNDQEPDKGKVTNDYSWYAISEQIGKDVASIPFNVFSGTRQLQIVANNNPHTGAQFTDGTYDSIPSVMGIQYMPVPGKSDGPNSAVNVAARAIYSWVRHQNSGSKNYEAVDLMLYILAMSSVYVQILEAKRVYKAAVTYSYLNRAIPDAILTALGVDADDVRANLAQLRAGINLRIAKLSSLCIPQAYDLFKRHALISSYVFADSDSERGQYYVFKTGGYWKFNATASTGGQLDFVSASPMVALTVEQLLSNIDDALDVLLMDEDINIMSGDILKAYGRDSLYTLMEVKDNEALDFVFDETILNQIENATTFSNFSNSFTMPSISQQNGYLYFAPTILNTGSNWVPLARVNAGVYLNSHKKDPSWQEVLEYTRLITTGDVSVGLNETNTPLTFGSEFVSGFYCVIMDYSKDTPAYVIDNSLTTDVRIIQTSTYPFPSMQSILRGISLLSTFDWHPQVHLWAQEDTSTVGNDPIQYYYYGMLADLKVYTRISAETIARLHDCAIMGEFKTQLIVSK